MSVTVPDEPIAVALGALPWGNIPIHGPDNVLLGRFVPGRRSWRSATWDGRAEATGDEVVALMRELRRVPPGIIVEKCINVANPALALLLAEADEDGTELHDPNGKLLGRFVPEPRPGRDEPRVVGDTPTGPK